MSIKTIRVVPPINAPGLGGFGGIREDGEAIYARLREECIANIGPDKCNSWLPRNMEYALTRHQSALPWWGWMIVGLAAGKVLRV